MKLQIKQVRFIKGSPLGREAVVLEYATPGYTTLDGKQIDIVFDKDPRFLRVDLVDKKTGKPYAELLPLTNVASLQVEEIK